MVDIFKEVEEDLRSQRMRSMWDRFGKYVIGVLIAIVLAVGGNQYWDYHTRNVQERESGLYTSAISMIEQGDRDGGLAALDSLRQSGSTGYRGLAAIREATVLADGGEIDDAIRVYESVAADSRTNRAIRDYGELMSISLLLDQGSDADVLIGRLERLAAPGAPWAHLATELEGVILLDAGRAGEARERFAALAANEDVANGVRQRAGALLELAEAENGGTDTNQ